MKLLLEADIKKAGYRKDLRSIVKNFSFGVEKGEAVILAGRNGSGKSTLLRTLMGDSQLYCEGTIHYEGEPAHLSPHWWNSRKVLWIPQEAGSFEELSVLENLRLFAGLYKMREIDSVFNFFPALEKLLNRRTGNLSGGERRMVDLSIVAYSNDISLLIIDEPTAALSVSNSSSFQNYVKTLVRTGTSLLITTHKGDFSELNPQIIELGSRT